MSMKINAGEVTRSDVFGVDPYQVMVKEDLRGRKFPPSDNDIALLAISMLDSTQMNPVQTRRVEDNKLLVVAGFTRTAAARLIRDGFEYGTDENGQPKRYHEPEFKLKCVVTTASDDESLTRNIAENAHRNDTSPIDDAFNHEKLRERRGWTDVQIAGLYGYPNSSKVSQYKKLLELNDREQKLVHAGIISVSAAVMMLSLPEADRLAFVDKAEAEGKANGAEINALVRSHHLRDDDKAEGEGEGGESTPSNKKKGVKPLTIREIRKFLTDLSEEVDQKPEIVAFSQSMLDWVNAAKGERSMKMAIKKLGGFVAPKAEKKAA